MWQSDRIWQGLGNKELLLAECRQCLSICHPPLPMCPRCQSLEWRSRRATGQATLGSWLISTDPGSADVVPRIVAVVQLAEGVNFVSNLTGTVIGDLYEGMPLELCFCNQDGLTLPLFRPLVSLGAKA